MASPLMPGPSAGCLGVRPSPDRASARPLRGGRPPNVRGARPESRRSRSVQARARDQRRVARREPARPRAPRSSRPALARWSRSRGRARRSTCCTR
jgi:hypothetical protein